MASLFIRINLERVQQWSDPRFRFTFVDRSTVGQHSASGAIHGSWITVDPFLASIHVAPWGTVAA